MHYTIYAFIQLKDDNITCQYRCIQIWMPTHIKRHKLRILTFININIERNVERIPFERLQNCKSNNKKHCLCETLKVITSTLRVNFILPIDFNVQKLLLKFFFRVTKRPRDKASGLNYKFLFCVEKSCFCNTQMHCEPKNS